MLSWLRGKSKKPAPPMAEPVSPLEGHRPTEIYVQFVLGLKHRPHVPITHVFEPVELDDALMPGATILGRFLYARPCQLTWVVRGVLRPGHSDPDLRGFEAHVFVSGEQDPEALRPALKRVYRAALLATLGDPIHVDIAAQTGQANLFMLAKKDQLSDEERAFQLQLEGTGLFVNRDVDGETGHLSLEEVRGASSCGCQPPTRQN